MIRQVARGTEFAILTGLKGFTKDPVMAYATKSRPHYAIPSGSHAALLGQVAIVTGCDSPFARAVSMCLANEGADIVMVYKAEHGTVRDTARRIRGQGARVLALCGDTDDATLRRQVADATLVHFGRSDSLYGSGVDIDLDVAQPAASGEPGDLAEFVAALRAQLRRQQVRLDAMSRGPLWTPVILGDPSIVLPANRHPGHAGPCNVFLASPLPLDRRVHDRAPVVERRERQPCPAY